MICISAAKFLNPKGGLLQLTGAVPSLGGTPGMLGYGMAKAAVHQLTKSLAEPGSGLPEGATVLAILPVTLDTPMNRKFMPDADFSSWTKLEFVVGKILEWKGKNFTNRPQNGALVKFVTKNDKTELIVEWKRYLNWQEMMDYLRVVLLEKKEQSFFGLKLECILAMLYPPNAVTIDSFAYDVEENRLSKVGSFPFVPPPPQLSGCILFATPRRKCNIFT